MKVARITGTRPQIMQIPILSRNFTDAGIEEVLIHTGQHYDNLLNDVFFNDLSLKNPDFNLNVGSNTGCKQTAKIIELLEDCLLEVRPDAVVVDGDTNSTLASAIAACKLNIPLIHVEAGVRTEDKTLPEEYNRVLTDHSSSLNCAPLPDSLINLQKEGLEETSVLTGDVLLDTFLNYKDEFSEDVNKKFNVKSRQYYVATIHRQENTGEENYERFRSILDAFELLDYPIIFPVHPRIREVIDNITMSKSFQNIILTHPMSYLNLMGLVQDSLAVLTDSGGLQREAVWSGVRCVVIYDRYVWKEQCLRGWSQLSGVDTDSIIEAVHNAKLPNEEEAIRLYGAGRASERIIENIVKRFN